VWGKQEYSGKYWMGHFIIFLYKMLAWGFAAIFLRGVGGAVFLGGNVCIANTATATWKSDGVSVLIALGGNGREGKNVMAECHYVFACDGRGGAIVQLRIRNYELREWGNGGFRGNGGFGGFLLFC
jgi:hypothetical protein